MQALIRRRRPASTRNIATRERQGSNVFDGLGEHQTLKPTAHRSAPRTHVNAW